ncbi:MAG TPA: hypothetical protein VF653_14485, partial [Methylomirabilota bacterium]
HWWAWHHWKNEPYAFGWVDINDNLYDGVQARTSPTPTVDEIGRPRIPGTGNWGDFVTGARAALLAMDEAISAPSVPDPGDEEPPVEEPPGDPDPTLDALIARVAALETAATEHEAAITEVANAAAALAQRVAALESFDQKLKDL